MSSIYTGVPGNIGALTPVTATIPSDGDALAAASINAALQKLTDYVALLGSGFLGVLTFGGIAGNAASTTYAAWLGGYRVDAMQALPPGSAGSVILVPFAFKIVGISVSGGNSMVGGSCSVQGYDDTASALIGPTVAIVGPQNKGYSTAGAATMAAGRYIGMQVVNSAGVTQGLGQFMGHLYITPA